jgi:hypothetical protein
VPPGKRGEGRGETMARATRKSKRPITLDLTGPVAALLMDATEAYRGATGPGRGYLGCEAAGAVYDAVPGMHKAAMAWIDATGEAFPCGYSGRDKFVGLAGKCCYGVELECRPVLDPVQEEPVPPKRPFI